MIRTFTSRIRYCSFALSFLRNAETPEVAKRIHFPCLPKSIPNLSIFLRPYLSLNSINLRHFRRRPIRDVGDSVLHHSLSGTIRAPPVKAGDEPRGCYPLLRHLSFLTLSRLVSRSSTSTGRVSSLPTFGKLDRRNSNPRSRAGTPLLRHRYPAD
jgi:hypothetical protein